MPPPNHAVGGGDAAYALGDEALREAVREQPALFAEMCLASLEGEPGDSVDHRYIEATNDLPSSGVPAWTGDFESVMTAVGEPTDAGSGGASSSNAPPPPSSISPAVTASASGSAGSVSSPSQGTVGAAISPQRAAALNGQSSSSAPTVGNV